MILEHKGLIGEAGFLPYLLCLSLDSCTMLVHVLGSFIGPPFSDAFLVSDSAMASSIRKDFGRSLNPPNKCICGKTMEVYK
jgi:hypothetical protein